MNRRIMLIAVAVVLAIAGTGGVYAYVKNADRRAVAGVQAKTIVIADRKIPVGTTWDKASSGGYLRTETVPAGSAPADALDSIGNQFGPQDVVSADIPAGQIVLRETFGEKAPTTSGLHIPDDKIAVSVKLSADEDVAGYVQPGSQIAIFDTFVLLDNGNAAGSKSAGDKNDNWATKLLLPRVDVLAVSQSAPSSTQAGLSGSAGSSATTSNLLVTVAVSQAEAERLIHVAQTGNPYLALLSDSSSTAPAPGVDNHGRLGPVFAK